MAEHRFRCPSCGKQLERVRYVDSGLIMRKGKEWTYVPHECMVEYFCPECNHKLNSKELEELGIF